MPIAKPVYFWEANVELDVRNIAFQASVGMKGKTKIINCDYVQDGKIIWNPAQRLKGWIKTNLSVLRPTYGEQAQAGIKVYPTDGNIDRLDIANSSELIGSTSPANLEEGADYQLSNGLPYPFHQYVIVGKGQTTRSVELLWYILPKTIPVSLKICCFARSITPEVIEDLMRKIGHMVGLGDKYSTGQYGLFELKKFEAKQERLNI